MKHTVDVPQKTFKASISKFLARVTGVIWLLALMSALLDGAVLFVRESEMVRKFFEWSTIGFAGFGLFLTLLIEISIRLKILSDDASLSELLEKREKRFGRVDILSRFLNLGCLFPALITTASLVTLTVAGPFVFAANMTKSSTKATNANNYTPTLSAEYTLTPIPTPQATAVITPISTNSVTPPVSTIPTSIAHPPTIAKPQPTFTPTATPIPLGILTPSATYFSSVDCKDGTFPQFRITNTGGTDVTGMQVAGISDNGTYEYNYKSSIGLEPYLTPTQSLTPGQSAIVTLTWSTMGLNGNGGDTIVLYMFYAVSPKNEMGFLIPHGTAYQINVTYKCLSF